MGYKSVTQHMWTNIFSDSCLSRRPFHYLFNAGRRVLPPIWRFKQIYFWSPFNEIVPEVFQHSLPKKRFSPEFQG